MPTPQRPLCQVSLPCRTLCGAPPAYEAVVCCEVDRTVRVRSLCMAHTRDIRGNVHGWECRTCDWDGFWHAVIVLRLRDYRPPPVLGPELPTG